MNILEFKKIENENKFEIGIDKNIFSFKIISAPQNAFIGEIENILIYDLNDDSKCTVEVLDSKVILTFYMDVNQQTFEFEISGSKSTKFNNNLLNLSNNDKLLQIESNNCSFLDYKNNILKVQVLSNEATLTFKRPFAQFKSFVAITDGVTNPDDTVENIVPGDTEEVIVPGDSFTSFVDDDVTYQVPTFQRGPEFSLGVFDLDGEPAAGKRARPVRLGVPVISMVPAYADNLGEADKFYYEKGVGPQSREVFFRVVCNKELSSQTVKLLVYMPNGLDTISPPDAIPLTKVSTSGSNSVYQGKYTFFEEDNVYSSDGFVYFSIYMDMVQEANLPIEATDADYVKPDNRQALRDLYWVLKGRMNCIKNILIRNK